MIQKINPIVKSSQLLGLMCISIIASFFSAAPIQALTNCDAEGTIYSGIATTAVDTYDVYVKLGNIGELADVSVSTSNGSPDCRSLGQLTASGSQWTKLPEPINATTPEIQFNLMSSQLESGYGYDRPMVMLVSRTTPACTPTTECFITINGEQAALQPTLTDADTGTLRVLSTQSVADQTIKEVRYYVDGSYMYKTAQLEPFDQQAIPYNGHTLSRVIEFTNGQTAVIEASVPSGQMDSLGAMLSRTARKYQMFLIWVGALIGVALAVYITRHIIMVIKDRRYWLYAHGFIKDESLHPVTPAQLAHVAKMEKIKRIAGGLGAVAVIGIVGISVILLVDSYIVRLSSVSGVSMEQTLHDGQKIFIDKTGVTFSSINQSDFIPQRGQIVAAYFTSRFEADREVRDEDLVIKRVMGLPGERVVINGSSVTIYNAEFPDGFDPATGATWAKNIVDDPSDARIDIKLGTDQVFVMGDNRPASVDSRANGPLVLRNIIGVVHG